MHYQIFLLLMGLTKPIQLLVKMYKKLLNSKQSIDLNQQKILNLMLAKFPSIFPSILLNQTFSHILLRTGKFAFCVSLNAALNKQILACTARYQLQSIFYANHKVMNSVNLVKILRKGTQLKLYNTIQPDQDLLIKKILLEIQLRWDQFIQKNNNNYGPFRQLLMFLNENKIYNLNQKIVLIDLLQILDKSGKKQKIFLLILIIDLNLQQQLDKKYAKSKAKILANAQCIKKNHIQVKDLVCQNIINILVYLYRPTQTKYLIDLWRHIIVKKLDTKFFNNFMAQAIIKSLQIANKNRQQFLFRDYIYLLNRIRAVKNDIQQITIKILIKNYPQDMNNIKESQIILFYSLTTFLPQLKQFIKQQQKIYRNKNVLKSNQNQGDNTIQQQKPITLLKLMQNQVIKQVKQITQSNLIKIAHYYSILSQFSSISPKLLNQMQQAIMEKRKKKNIQINYYQFTGFLFSISTLYKNNKIKFSQMKDFYKQIVQFMIKHNLDQLNTMYLTKFLFFLNACQSIQFDQRAQNRLQTGTKENLIGKKLFGYENQLVLKISSTLTNKKRIITSKDMLKIIPLLLKLKIVNQDICQFIKQKTQELLKTQKDQKLNQKIQNIVKIGNQYLCAMQLKNCICKSSAILKKRKWLQQ